eukprot:m.88514 g.88514  ORF g.88514 m.88514 type:complete len:136 (-) comp12864_c0_seq2:1236-1643(-)
MEGVLSVMNVVAARIVGPLEDQLPEACGSVCKATLHFSYHCTHALQLALREAGVQHKLTLTLRVFGAAASGVFITGMLGLHKNLPYYVDTACNCCESWCLVEPSNFPICSSNVVCAQHHSIATPSTSSCQGKTKG